MDSILEETSPPPHFRGRRLKPLRRLSRFERWARSPIIAYRIGLTTAYAITIPFGISGLLAGVPAFVVTAPEGYVVFWAAAVIIGGLTAAVGSIESEGRDAAGAPTRLSRVFRSIELVGAWLLFLTIGSYAGVLLIIAWVQGDIDRSTAGLGFVALGAQPFWRMVWLMSQLGRRRE